MRYQLAVLSAFRGYQRGDLITDPAEVERILGGEDVVHVVKLAAPSEPAKEQ